MNGGWIWYELMTPDAGGAKAFYEAVVDGWRFAVGTAETKGYGFISIGEAMAGPMVGGVLTLTDGMIAGGARPGWIGYIQVPDVDAAVAQIEAAGGKCLWPPVDEAMAGRFALVADPDGAPFYIMAPNSSEESTCFSPTLAGRCAWNELHAGDPARAIDFYTGRFGWALPPAMDMGEYGKYQYIELGGVPLGGILGSLHGLPPHWNHYFRVPSIAAAAGLVPAHGGTATQPPMQVPNGDWIIHGTDPQGAHFCLVGGK